MSKVSAVIPTYNDRDTLKTATESALNQTHEDIEVIVVDDGSDDNPETALKNVNDDRLVFIEHDTNRGGSAARNTGIEAATGEYIGFLDADDEWHPIKVERQLRELKSRSEEWVAVYCGFEYRRSGKIMQIINDRFKRPTGFEGDKELINRLLCGTLALGGSSTLFVRTSAIEKIGGWDENFPRLQDIEFTIRLLQYGKLAYIDESLVQKNDTGNPSAEAVEKAQRRFFEAFDEEIAEAEAQGLDPKAVHRFFLAKIYFSTGRFLAGLKALSKSTCPHTRDVLGLGLAIKEGIKQRIEGYV